METKKTVDILPEDEKNMNTIHDRIVGGELTTSEAISKAVDEAEFSSDETKTYVKKSILTLFEAGAYKKPPVKGVDITAVDTDKVA